jgi:stage IV sporulation protein FB
LRPFYLFTAFQIPVHVSPFFLLLVWMFGRGEDMQGAMLWGVCIVIGLVVHEFGHALVARAFGLGPEVLLHGWGGLTSHQRAETRQDDALIVASGPAAGLVLGLFTLALMFALEAFAPALLGGRALPEIVNKLLYVSLGWSVFNLLPVWPLDGGQLLRLGAQRVLPSARTADRLTHITALTLIGGYLLWFFSNGGRGGWTVLMLLLLGWENYSALKGQRSSGTVHKSYAQGGSMLRAARAAFEAGNMREAARLCHVTRADASLSPEQLSELWALLGRATTKLGRHEEALSYLKRAQRSAAVDAATRRCLEALGREDQHEELTQEQVRRSPRSARRRWLWIVVVFDLVCMAGIIVFQFAD